MTRRDFFGTSGGVIGGEGGGAIPGSGGGGESGGIALAANTNTDCVTLDVF